MVDEWRVGRGSTLWYRLGRRSKCKMATWSKVENIVSTSSRVDGRGKVARGLVERSKVECPYRLPYIFHGVLLGDDSRAENSRKMF